MVFLNYLDPGSGSLIVQALAAVAMAVMVSLESVKTWIKAKLSFIFQRKAKKDDKKSK